MIPYGTRDLIITCVDPNEQQFQGILKLAGKIDQQHNVHAQQWDGRSLNLVRRRSLKRVLVSGHGADDHPALSGPPILRPQVLLLPSRTRLYLLACYQGRYRPQWARGTGVPVAQILASKGETESALSTCLLLHLMQEGMASVDRWFPGWLHVNNYLQPHFPEFRRLYRHFHEQPLPTLEALSGAVDLSTVGTFLDIIKRYPQYLTDLLD